MLALKYKGIVLAGGTGSRLYPSTIAISKQLVPVYDKPLIYYPISTLLLAGIREILIISTPDDLPLFKKLLGSGDAWGVEFSYIEQERPEGLAQALVLAEDYLEGNNICLILGDNIFYGVGFASLLKQTIETNNPATIFSYYVKDPERYGVVEFDSEGKATKVVEKPKIPPSNYAITGLYFYNSTAIDIAKNLKPSARGEYEITDVNSEFMKRNQLNVVPLGRGYAWLDTGTHESILEANSFVAAIENRQGLKIACPEEIAWRMGYIDSTQLAQLAKKFKNSTYGEYISLLVK